MGQSSKDDMLRDSSITDSPVNGPVDSLQSKSISSVSFINH